MRWSYIGNGKVVTNFLKICEVFDGIADTIETTLVTYMEDKGLSVFKMVGVGTDVANVMTGVHNGVGARFKRRQPNSHHYPLCMPSLGTCSSSSWK